MSRTEGVILKPRRLRILRILRERDFMKISELRDILGIPISTLYYDLEILRANGLIEKNDNYVRITERGKELIDELKEAAEESIRDGLGDKLTNILMLRPFVMPLLNLPLGESLIFSMAITILGLYLALTSNLRMIYLTFAYSPSPHAVLISVIASVSSYFITSLLIYKFALKGRLGLGFLRSTFLALIPVALYPSLSRLLYALNAIAPMAYTLLDASLKALMPLITAMILSNAFSVMTGRTGEHTLVLTMSFIAAPSYALYIAFVR